MPQEDMIIKLKGQLNYLTFGFEQPVKQQVNICSNNYPSTMKKNCWVIAQNLAHTGNLPKAKKE